MGFMDNFKAEIAGRKAYGLHVSGNRLYDAGKTAEAQAKHNEALKLYEQAIAGGCDRPSYVMAYGVLLLRFSRFEEARKMFLKAEASPAITKAEKNQLRLDFAVCEWKLGHLDSAISQMKIAMGDAPTGLIYGSLGYMLIEKARQTGDFQEAEAFNLKALDYDDEDPVVVDNLGQLYLAMGDRDKAYEYFVRAHELKPRQVDTLYYLASLLAIKGETEQALEYLNTALDGNYSALCTTTPEQALALKVALERDLEKKKESADKSDH